MVERVCPNWGLQPSINGYWFPESLMVRIFLETMTLAKEARALSLVCKSWRDLTYVKEVQKFFVLLEILEASASIEPSGDKNLMLSRVSSAFLKLQKPDYSELAIQLTSGGQDPYVLRARCALVEFLSKTGAVEKILTQIILVGFEARESWDMEFSLAVSQNWPEGVLQSLKRRALNDSDKLFKIAQIEATINRESLVETMTDVINRLIALIGREVIDYKLTKVMKQLQIWKEKKVLGSLDFLLPLFKIFEENVILQSPDLQPYWWIVLAQSQLITHPEQVASTLQRLKPEGLKEFAYQLISIKVKMGDLAGAEQILLDNPDKKFNLTADFAEAISNHKDFAIRNQLPLYVQRMEAADLENPSKYNIWTLAEYITKIGEQPRAQQKLKEAFDNNPVEMLRLIKESGTSHFYLFAGAVMASQVAGQMLQTWIEKCQADPYAFQEMSGTILTAGQYNPAMAREAVKCIPSQLSRVEAMFSMYFWDVW